MLIRFYLARYAANIKKIATFFVTTVIPLFYTTNLMAVLPGFLLTLIDIVCTWIGDPTPDRILTTQEKRKLNTKVARGHILCTSLNGKLKYKYLHCVHDDTKYLLDGNIICRYYYDESNDQDVLELYGDKTEIRYLMDKCYATDDNKEFTVNIIKGSRIQKINYRSNPVYAPEFVGDERFQFINKKVKKFMENENFYARTGLPYKMGFCFSGTKGVGKTQIAYALAKNYKLNIIEIPSTYTFDVTEHSISFDSSVILLDDFDLFEAVTPRVISRTVSRSISEEIDSSDSIFETSTNTSSDKAAKLKLKDLMKFLEGHYFHQTIIIATTNYPDRIENALLRPGRLDYLVEFGEINNEDIQKVINRFYEEDIDLKKYEFKPIKISSLIHDFIIPNMHDPNACVEKLEGMLKKDT